MLEKQSKAVSYTWLILFAVISMFSIFDAGFDHDIVFVASLSLIIVFLIVTLINKTDIEVNQISLIFIGFIGFALLSVFWSIYPIRTIIESIQLFIYLLVYLMTRRISSNELHKFIKGLFLVATLFSVLGFAEFIFSGGSRIYVTFTNPNPFGIFMVMMFLMSLNVFIHSRTKTHFILGILLLSTVLLTGSRASLGALIISLIVLLTMIDKKERHHALKSSLSIIVLSFILSQGMMMIVLYLKNTGLNDYTLIESITRSDSFVTSSLVGRLEFWRVAFDLFKNKPVLGYGEGTFFSAYYIEYGMNIWYSRFAHNHYLQILSELGFIGISLFIGFLVSSLTSVLKNRKESIHSIYYTGSIAAVVAFLLHIGVDFTWNFPAVTSLFFVFLAIMTENSKVKIKLNYKLFSLILIIFFLITAWQYGSSKLYIKALSYETNHSVDKAIELTHTINKFYPISTFGLGYESDLRYKKYLTTNNSNDLEVAYVLAQKALDLSPYDSQSLNRVAKLCSLKNDFDSAKKFYNKAAKYGAYQIYNYVDLSALYYKLGEQENAIQTLEKALELSPYTIRNSGINLNSTVDMIAIIHLKLAKTYQELGKNEDVKRHINELLELKEEYPFVEKYFNN